MMPEKLEPMDFIRALMEPLSVEKGTPTYTADQGFQQWVIENANVVVERYRQSQSNLHWTKNDLKNALIGFSGQLAFERLLQYLNTPYDTDEPIARIRKPFDFKLSIGTVEVKSYDHYCQYTIIKDGEWKGNDFLIVWQYADNTHNRIILKGWLTKQEVESYPIIPKGECPQTPLASARVIPMKKLHEPKKFIEKMKTASVGQNS